MVAEREETHLEIMENTSDSTEFDPTKKKKKKKKRAYVVADAENVDPRADSDGDKEEEGQGIAPSFYPLKGTDQDYEYEELLNRVFNILRENNPELAGDRPRTVLKPLQIVREGIKKTVFVNFMEYCKMMHRQPEDFMAFLLTEMGTSGSLDGQQRLSVNGRFATKNFEGLTRRYINEYVTCNSCRSPDTIITKENRLLFLQCQQCGSGRSVAPIKAGFVARVGHRKN